MSQALETLMMNNTAEIKKQVNKIQNKIDMVNIELNNLSIDAEMNADKIYKLKLEKQEWEVVLDRYRYGLLQPDSLKKNKNGEKK